MRKLTGESGIQKVKNKHGRKNCKKIVKPKKFKVKPNTTYTECLFNQSRKFRLEFLGSRKFYVNNHKYN